MKIILIATLTFFTFVSFSQGNLQFNQVKLVSTQETVPTGKVWKVESAVFQGGGPFCIGSGVSSNCGQLSLSSVSFIGVMNYLVNNQPNYISLTQYSTSLSQQISPFPFWLPAGTTLAASTNMRYLSVIEFNIIP